LTRIYKKCGIRISAKADPLQVERIQYLCLSVSICGSIFWVAGIARVGARNARLRFALLNYAGHASPHRASVCAGQITQVPPMAVPGAPV